jgi:hypothetical protein
VQNTIQFPQRLLREFDQKYLTSSIKEDEFEVEYFGSIRLKLVQILAMIFNYLKRTIECCV